MRFGLIHALIHALIRALYVADRSNDGCGFFDGSCDDVDDRAVGLGETAGPRRRSGAGGEERTGEAFRCRRRESL